MVLSVDLHQSNTESMHKSSRTTGRMVMKSMQKKSIKSHSE